jgi:hypothetical protein
MKNDIRDYNGIHKRGSEKKEWKEGRVKQVNEYRRKVKDPAGILKGPHVFLLSLKSVHQPQPPFYQLTQL